MSNKKGTIGKVLYFLFGLLLLSLLGFGGYKLIQAFLDFITRIEKEIAAAIIAAMTTIIVSVLSIVIAKYYEKKKEFELEIRAKKIPVYEDFISFTFKILNKEIKPENKDDFNKFFMDFSQKLLIWGSDEVIQAWSNYRKNSNKPDQTLLLLEKVLFAIRKDTGHKNRKLKQSDLLRIFINDI